MFGTVSFAGVKGVTLGVVLTGVSGGSGEVKLKEGKAEVLMGSEMAGRSGTSTTCSQRTNRSISVCSTLRIKAFYEEKCKPLKTFKLVVN